MINIKISGKWQEVDHSLPFRVVSSPHPGNGWEEVTVYAFELAGDAVKVCEHLNETSKFSYYIGGPLTDAQMSELEVAGYY